MKELTIKDVTFGEAIRLRESAGDPVCWIKMDRAEKWFTKNEAKRLGSWLIRFSEKKPKSRGKRK